MRAPQYERARVLCTAINQAASELAEPIDRLEVQQDQVRVSAGREQLVYRYRYVDAYASDGSPLPGSGTWAVEMIAGVERTGPWRRLAAWLRK
jgi:hypothetical protein